MRTAGSRRRGARRRPKRHGDLALLGAAFFYGTTFVVVQDAVEDASPSAFLAARFLVAAVVLAPFALRRPTTPRLGRAGAAAGLTMLAGYVLQTVGLQYTTASRSAFLTYLLVVLVPVLAAATLKRPPARRVLLAIAIAVVGLVLLTDTTAGGFGRGELLTVGCALAFAANVVVIAAVVEHHDVVWLTFLQSLVMGGALLVPGFFQGGYGFDGDTWLAVAFTGVFASAVAFGLQIGGQRTVGPSRAALILLMEPVFGGVLGYLDGDRLAASGVAGAALICVAVLVSELAPTRPDDAPLTAGSMDSIR